MEARQALYCDLGEVPVIIGLVASLAFGWWWADPLVALAIVPLLLREPARASAATPAAMLVVRTRQR